MRDSTHHSERSSDASADLSMTRRAAMALLGAGTIAGAAGSAGAVAGADGADHRVGDAAAGQQDAPTRKWNQHVDAQGHDLRNVGALDASEATLGNLRTAARDADVLVWRDEDDTFHADGREETVHSGEDFTEAVQAALDSLTDGRETKEKVVVTCSGTMGPHDFADTDDVEAIDVPSYTILDFRGTIYVEDEGEAFVRPLRALDAEEIEIPRVQIVGNPRAGIWFRSVSNVRFGHVDVRMPAEDRIEAVGGGVRIDGFAEGRGEDTIRTTDVQVDSAYFENTAGHAFETYAVDRLQIGRVIANRTQGGCGVLLNETTDTTVDAVVGRDIDYEGGGYAAFRLANGSHDVTCGQVVCRGGARGVFGVSGSHNWTVGAVNIADMDVTGIFVEDNQNVTIGGGVVKNCQAEAVRIHSRDSFRHDPTNGVTIRDLRTFDDRPEGEREQSHGIYVSGEQTSNVRILDCDVRAGGTEQNVRVEADETILRGNHGGGLATGTVTLSGGAEPAATVEGVSPFGYQSPSLRADPVEPAGATFAFDHYFEWDADAESWTLVFEWKRDPGEDVDVQYVVDAPRANLGAGTDDGGETPELAEGTYTVTAALNDDSVVMSVEGDPADGANVYNDARGEASGQRWTVTELDDGSYRIDAADADDLVLEAADGGTDTGTNLVLGTWAAEDYQRFDAVAQGPDHFSLRPTHAELAVDVWEVDPEPGADLRHWEPTGAENQAFAFLDPDDG